MKKLALVAAAFIAFIVAAPVHAQLTGPSELHLIGDNLAQLDGYAVVMGSNTILLKDASTGRTLFVIQETNPQTITLSSVVTSAGSTTPADREQLLKSIALFNISSPVGTLWLEDATGEVTMEHHLNPRFVSPSNIVNVAMLFGDAVRAEKTLLMQ